jgi:hypothetical protein
MLDPDRGVGRWHEHRVRAALQQRPQEHARFEQRQ